MSKVDTRSSRARRVSRDERVEDLDDASVMHPVRIQVKRVADLCGEYNRVVATAGVARTILGLN